MCDKNHHVGDARTTSRTNESPLLPAELGTNTSRVSIGESCAPRSTRVDAAEMHGCVSATPRIDSVRERKIGRKSLLDVRAEALPISVHATLAAHSWHRTAKLVALSRTEWQRSSPRRPCASWIASGRR